MVYRYNFVSNMIMVLACVKHIMAIAIERNLSIMPD